MDELFEKFYDLMLKLLNLRRRRRSATLDVMALAEELGVDTLPPVRRDGYTNAVQPIIRDDGFAVKELSSEYPVEPNVWLDVAITSANKAVEINEAVTIPMEKIRDKLEQLKGEMVNLHRLTPMASS